MYKDAIISIVLIFFAVPASLTVIRRLACCLLSSGYFVGNCRTVRGEGGVGTVASPPGVPGGVGYPQVLLILSPPPPQV